MPPPEAAPSAAVQALSKVQPCSDGVRSAHYWTTCCSYLANCTSHTWTYDDDEDEDDDDDDDDDEDGDDDGNDGEE